MRHVCSLRSLPVSVGLALLLVACGSKADGTGSASATASSSPPRPSASTSSKPADTSAAGDDSSSDTPSIASLRDKAASVMAALKKGDAKAAADYCLGKHRDGLEKFIGETLKEGGGRPKAYQDWDGKFPEIRTKAKMARVQIGEEEGKRIVYLSFRDHDGTWSLDDIPVLEKGEWSKWGQVAN
jgi:hypothetical protein